jgi:2-methylcitrate dehydratase PrpD
MATFETVEDMPRGVSVRITAILEDGRKLASQIDYPKGSIQNPMSDDELRNKFMSLAEPVLGEGRAAELADKAMNVEQVGSVADLMKLTVAR